MRTQMCLISRQKSGMKQIVFMIALAFLSFAFLNNNPVQAQSEIKNLSALQREARLSHARELMGRHYRGSVVRTGEEVRKINKFIYRWTRQSLPDKHKDYYKQVAQTIVDESFKHGFDPILIMAVIQRESVFNPEARGKLDEIGLMQIRPGTGEWMAKKINLKWAGSQTLLNPVENIRLGTAYLAYLRELFDSNARLYLTAYNLGQRKLRKYLSKRRSPREYPTSVMHSYLAYYAELRSIRSSPVVAMQTPNEP